MCSMKKLGFFLLKNNIHIMTLIFLGWAVWAACNWSHLLLVQKVVMGLYALLIVHEYEEGYKGRLSFLNYRQFCSPGKFWPSLETFLVLTTRDHLMDRGWQYC